MRVDDARERRERRRSRSADSIKKKKKKKKKNKKKKDKTPLQLVRMPVLPAIVIDQSSSTGFSPAKDTIVLPTDKNVKLNDEDLNTSLNDLNLDVRPLVRIGNMPIWAVGKDDGSKTVFKRIDLDKRSPGIYDNCSNFEFCMREVRFMRKVQSHPNILPVIAFYGNEKELIIEMPLTTKGDLYSRVEHYKSKHDKLGIANMGMTEIRTRSVMRQILSGVAHMHSKNVAHRDLKLENILYFEEDGRGVVKICDFEFACDPDKCDIDIVAKFLGSWFSMSPEMVVSGIMCGANIADLQRHFQRKRDDDTADASLWWDWFKTDIWSCGVIMFACLHGYFPFYGCIGDAQSLQQMRVDMFDKPLEFRSDLSAECQMVLTNLLDLTPERRMTADHLLELPWFTLGRQTPVLSGFASRSGSVASL